MPALLDQLESLTRAAPGGRKIFVAADLNAGRDLLAALALRMGGWIGWEVMTLRGLAGELAMVELHRRGMRAARDLEVTALIESALDDLAAGGRLSSGSSGLRSGSGFRRAVRDAILELRVRGVASDALARASGTSAGRDLALILARYRESLDARGLVDAGGLFEQALAAFDEQARHVISGQLFLAPGLEPRGLPGRLAARLADAGANTLPEPSERPEAPAGPSVTLFMAATPADEVREVLRRICREQRRWDEVEIVATDPDAYGTALDAIASRAGIPATYLAGLPLGRSRLGRLVARWFEWIERGLPDHLLREAIEAGDLAAGAELPSPQLVRLLRTLAIGWSRNRYLRALEDLRRGLTLARDHEYPEDEQSESDWETATRQLRTILSGIIAATPPGPEPGQPEPPPLSPGVLAGSLRQWLEYSPVRDEAEEHARARLATRLALCEREMHATRPFGGALAALRDALADFRIWPALGPDRRPWNMCGGHLHLTDLAHAGTTGRRRIFVLGLDAERAAGPRIQDPLLPDAIRARIGGDLATTAERRDERRRLVRRALASLAGDVTLSWALAADGGREASPAPVLLDIARQTLGNPDLSFEGLRAELSPPAAAVPGPGVMPLDVRDVWLGAIAPGSVLLDGTSQALERWPELERGLRLAGAWESDVITAAHGVVPAAREEDPRRRQTPISASSLQLLAACPLAWLYRHAMRLRPVEDAEFEPGAWLSPLDRGALLHTVFERFAREWMDRQDRLQAPEAEAAVVATARAVFGEWQRKVPAPAAGIVEAEWEYVRQSALSFLLMERDGGGARWMVCEMELLEGDRRPVLRLPDGSRLAVWGRIDRVDRREDGRLVIIDFKTGSTWGFAADGRGGAFRGGRQLQSGLYALAAEQLLKAEVAVFEYRFPTPKGENQVARHERAELDAAPGVILDLLGQVERGEFLPTMDSHDCAYCEFREICRVRDGRFHKVHSPRAEWAGRLGATDPRFEPMRRRRGEKPG
ncbi:MAG: PD-(D/E)XK nuclease family protein [Gemmatimonadota bacterium]|nr:PD-(D/E)XK nuclease family protein [Gemmatimonadota bacterium]MDH5282509.1 PD-(D/E)XK nuclease family protein [Gemmatimonadota bacterium]